MAVFIDAATASRGTGPSPIIWNQIPSEVITGARPGKGFGFFEDFIVGPISTTSYWFGTSTAVASGTYVDAGLEGGVIAFTPDVEDKGIQIQGNAGFVPAADFHMACECRFKLTDADQTDFMVGFSGLDTTALGLNDEALAIGCEDGSALLKYVSRSDGTGSFTTTGTTMEDDTFYRAGFIQNGTKDLKVYVDGALAISYTTACSDEAMAPTIALLSGEASANCLYLDWVYFYGWYDDAR